MMFFPSEGETHRLGRKSMHMKSLKMPERGTKYMVGTLSLRWDRALKKNKDTVSFELERRKRGLTMKVEMR